MKLSMNSAAGLMTVSEIRADGSCLIVYGTILGAVPVRAVLTAAELRKAFPLLGLKTILAAIAIFLFR